MGVMRTLVESYQFDRDPRTSNAEACSEIFLSASEQCGQVTALLYLACYSMRHGNSQAPWPVKMAATVLGASARAYGNLAARRFSGSLAAAFRAASGLAVVSDCLVLGSNDMPAPTPP